MAPIFRLKYLYIDSLTFRLKIIWLGNIDIISDSVRLGRHLCSVYGCYQQQRLGANQSAIYKPGQGCELGTTDKQIQLVVRARHEFKTFTWQGQYFDLSAILPRVWWLIFPLVALLDYLGRIAPLFHPVICKLIPAMTCWESIFLCNQDCVPVL